MSTGVVVLDLGIGLLSLFALMFVVTAIKDVNIAKITGLDPRNDRKAANEAAAKVRKHGSL